VDADPLLRRLERTAVAACLSFSLVALLAARGRPGPAVAVLGGGLLIAVSYRTIGSAVGTVVVHRMGGVGAPPPRLVTILAKVLLRYALLTVLAYVMIARLRLHPIGLLVGASSVVAAAAVEAVRLRLKRS
jgi:hypothetical protein